MISGHTILHIISTFLVYLVLCPNYITIFILFPLPIFHGIYYLELGVSIIQAYVFTVLTLTYISDSLELKH